MQIESENKQITKKDIEEFENFIHAKLPSDYKDFLLKYNGGEPDNYIFSKNSKLGKIVLNVLYGIDADNDYDDLKETYNIFKNQIHGDFITIGDDPGGNQYLLGTKGVFRNKVYFWDHNTELDNDEFTEDVLPGNMYLLADSFNEFIENLEEDTEA